MTDSLALYLAAGRHLHPWLDHTVAAIQLFLPGVLLVIGFHAAGGIWRAITAAVRRYRTRRHVPAAADNQPGTDPIDLWHCRHILAASNDQPRKETP
ncbi:hypothetical protein ACWEP4_40520 [Streptomyces sp. NPDC004227]